MEIVLFTRHFLGDSCMNYLTKFGTSEFVESRGAGKQFSKYLVVECLSKRNVEKMSLKEDFWS